MSLGIWMTVSLTPQLLTIISHEIELGPLTAIRRNFGSRFQNKAYIKGARALPSVRMISAPNMSMMKTMGPSQYFFLTFKNCQNSAAMESLLILNLLPL
jgi:hypothetical protein